MKHILPILFELFIIFSSISAESQFYPERINHKPSVYMRTRFYNTEGYFGSSTPINGLKGNVEIVDTKEKIDSFKNLEDKSTAFLKGDLFTKENVDKLAESGKLIGIIVDFVNQSNCHVNHDSQTVPSLFQKLVLHPNEIWNSKGDNLLWTNYNFPIVYEVDEDESNEIKRLINSKQSGYYYSNFQHYMGPNDMNSIKCIAKYACDPMGGQSIWTSIGDLSNNNNKPIILITTKIDSLGEYYDLTPGEISVSTQITVLISVIKSIFKTFKDNNNNNMKELSHNYIFVFLQGESWGFLGGRKLFFDIENFKCHKEVDKDKSGLGERICIKPIKLSLEFKNINLSLIESIISLDQIININDNNKLYIHSENNKEKDEYLNKIIEIGKKINGSSNIVLEESNSGKGLPPSFVSYLLKYNKLSDKQHGYVISGYKDQYIDEINSMCDNPNTLKIDINTLIEKTKFISNLIVKLGESESINVEYNPSIMVKNLHYCLSYNNSCDYFDQKSDDGVEIYNKVEEVPYYYYPNYYSGSYSFGRMPVFIKYDKWFGNTYALNIDNLDEYSLYAKYTFIETFIYGMLNYIMSDVNSNNSNDDNYCDEGDKCENGGVCVFHKCVRSNVHFHDAVSPHISYTNEADPVIKNVSEIIDGLITEPYWGGRYGPSLTFRTYYKTTIAVEVVSLIIGLIVLLLSCGSSWYVMKKTI